MQWGTVEPYSLIEKRKKRKKEKSYLAICHIIAKGDKRKENPNACDFSLVRNLNSKYQCNEVQ